MSYRDDGKPDEYPITSEFKEFCVRELGMKKVRPVENFDTSYNEDDEDK